jgi:two-component system OmpR family response regulator
LLAQYLELNGYKVQVVPNGKEAIQWLQENEHPDVVLMDMNMPEMDGPETIQQIRSNRHLNSLRLFGVSGLDQEEAGVTTGEDGVDRWFTKPVDARQLIRELTETSVANIA